MTTAQNWEVAMRDGSMIVELHGFTRRMSRRGLLAPMATFVTKRKDMPANTEAFQVTNEWLRAVHLRSGSSEWPIVLTDKEVAQVPNLTSMLNLFLDVRP